MTITEPINFPDVELYVEQFFIREKKKTKHVEIENIKYKYDIIRRGLNRWR
jgi:hypothetical protein